MHKNVKERCESLINLYELTEPFRTHHSTETALIKIAKD